MNRVWLLIGVAAVAAGLTLTACRQQPEAAKPAAPAGEPAAAAPEVVALTYANFPPASTFPCVQMERWREVVEQKTGGKVKVQTFPGGTLLGAKNMFDGVADGVADIGCFAMSYQPGRFPVSEAVDLPMGFDSSRVASLTLYDLINKRQPDEFKNVKVVTLFTCPPVNFMTSKPVRSLADLEGVQIRAAGTGVEALKMLGGTPVAMPQSDVPDAIQKGVVSGIASSLEVLKDMNYAAYCPYSTRLDLNVVTFAVVMNRKKWDALTDDVKKAIEELGRPHAEWTGQYVDDHAREALAWAKENRGHEHMALAQADRERMAKMLQPMVEAYMARVSEKGLDGKGLVEQVRSIKAEVEQQVAMQAVPATQQAAK